MFCAGRFETASAVQNPPVCRYPARFRNPQHSARLNRIRCFPPRYAGRLNQRVVMPGDDDDGFRVRAAHEVDHIMLLPSISISGLNRFIREDSPAARIIPPSLLMGAHMSRHRRREWQCRALCVGRRQASLPARGRAVKSPFRLWSESTRRHCCRKER